MPSVESTRPLTIAGSPRPSRLIDPPAGTAEVGAEAFVAAMSFVKAGFKVPPRTLVAGIPAKVKRALTDQEIEWKMQGTREYQMLAQRCLATLREVAPLTAPEPGRKRGWASSVEPLHKLKRNGRS